jgi:hypothetical protein
MRNRVIVVVVSCLLLQGCATIVGLNLSTRLEEIDLTSSVVDLRTEGTSVLITVPLTIDIKDSKGFNLALTYGYVEHIESWTWISAKEYKYRFTMEVPSADISEELEFTLWKMHPDTEAPERLAGIKASVQRFNYAKRTAVSFAILSFFFWATK